MHVALIRLRPWKGRAYIGCGRGARQYENQVFAGGRRGDWRLALGSQAAQAGIICQGCEYGDDVGTYLGSYNPTTFDFGTFNHSDVGIDEGPSTAFEDFWVFDLDPGGTGSISADFTAFTAIAGFHGELYADNGGTTCAGSDCSVIDLGAFWRRRHLG